MVRTGEHSGGTSGSAAGAAGPTVATLANPPPPARTTLPMDVRLKPFDFAQAVARAGLRPDGTPLAPRASGAQGAAPASFQSAMTQALRQVSASQLEAQRLQREVQLDNPAVSLEQTMIAMQRAQIGFQAALQVRNKLVQAYSEIMNMQV